MIETQIELTEHEIKALKNLSLRTGKKETELIREAVEQLIQRSSVGDRVAILKVARGIWKDRTDLPDFERLRKEWDRYSFL